MKLTDLRNLIQYIAIENRTAIRDLLTKVAKEHAPATERDLMYHINRIPQQIIKLNAASRFVFETPPRCELSEIELSVEVGDAVSNFIAEQRCKERIREAGLTVANKILLSGPSGCGKTSIAHAIAKAVDLPLVVLSIGSTIDSHMGQTGNNIATLFREIRLFNCILLLDECDAILRVRGTDSNSASAECNRIAATLLNEFDAFPGDSIIVAATNLPDAIDSAFLRRFDLNLKIEQPSEDALASWATKLADRLGVSTSGIDLGKSYATARRAIEQAAKRKLIGGAK